MKQVLRGLVTIVLALLVFFGVGSNIQPVIIPSPVSLAEFVISGRSWQSMLSGSWVTGGSTLLSFILACSWAIPVGITLGVGSRLRKDTAYLIDLARSIPPSALVPVGILLIGTGRSMFIALTTGAVGLMIIVIVREAVLDLPPVWLRQFRQCRYPNWRKMAKLYVPAVLGAVRRYSRILISLSLALMVVCELLLPRAGLGAEIQAAQLSLRPVRMYAFLLAAGIVGVALNQIVRGVFLAVESQIFRPLEFPDE